MIASPGRTVFRSTFSVDNTDRVMILVRILNDTNYSTAKDDSSTIRLFISDRIRQVVQMSLCRSDYRNPPLNYRGFPYKIIKSKHERNGVCRRHRRSAVRCKFARDVFRTRSGSVHLRFSFWALRVIREYITRIRRPVTINIDPGRVIVGGYVFEFASVEK